VPFTVRDFQAADFDTLWRSTRLVFLRYFLFAGGTETVHAPSASFTLIAEAGTRCRHCGFIVAEAEPGRGHIITIDVIAAARRFGMGSLLLRLLKIA